MMRHFLFLAFAILSGIGGPAALAHDGTHSPDVLAVVVAAGAQGNTVAVSLVLTGLGGPLVLTGVSTPGARAADMDPVPVGFALDVPVLAVLDFSGPPPGIFTLELDFGPLGRGGVTVIPEPDQTTNHD